MIERHFLLRKAIVLDWTSFSSNVDFFRFSEVDVDSFCTVEDDSDLDVVSEQAKEFLNKKYV